MYVCMPDCVAFILQFLLVDVVIDVATLCLPVKVSFEVEFFCACSLCNVLFDVRAFLYDSKVCLLNDLCGYWNNLLSDAELMCLMMLKHMSDVFLKFSYIWYDFDVLIY